MSKIDLIVQCIESDIDEPSTQGLLTAVADGTGFVGWHGGVLVGFPRSEAYYQMIGGKFVAHPAKAPAECTGSEEDFFIPHTIEITPVGKLHPITQQLNDFELITEQYWLLTDPYMHVLATTTQLAREGDPWDSEVISPAMWVRQWGKGKIFICSPGHNLNIVAHDSVTTAIQNGLIWASR
jgi:type 1 glutamine amidotransferase